MNYLILCTGNTCRSPMAAAILQQMLKEKGDTSSGVISAGLQTIDGLPANPNAVAAMKEWGMDLSGHHSRQVTPFLLKEAHRIFVMTPTQARTLVGGMPLVGDKVTSLDVADPFGQDLDTYRRCRDQLKEKLEKLVNL